MAQISYTKRFSYAASDTAGQLVFCFVAWYQSYFYTDVYGISAAVAGTILLVARWVDAVDAPIWGIIFDKTHSRWGKSRPWFLWLCVPFATFGVLTFLTPNLGHTGKVCYAVGTYIACNVLYTGINTPVTSILSALTSEPGERVMLTCWRMFGSKLGVLIVNLTALRMVNYLSDVTSLSMFGSKLWGLVQNLASFKPMAYFNDPGYREAYHFIAQVTGGSEQVGFIATLPIYATGTVLLFLFAFRNLEEVVKEERKHVPIRGTFGAIKGNWPWLIIASSSLCFWIAFVARVSAMLYFFKYNLNRKDLVPIAFGLDFISLATVFFLPNFCKWTSKRNVWFLGLLGMVLGQVLVYVGVVAGNWLGLIMAGLVFGFLASGVAMAMPFSVLSDSVDYGEWKTGIRAPGLLTAIGAAFCLKAGGGFGGAFPMWIMQQYGYVADVTQTATSLRGIAIGFIWLPAVFFALAAVPVLFYKRYEMMEPQIHAELDARRALAPGTAAANV
jgi:Na+/melibiose symporter-like transporter